MPPRQLAPSQQITKLPVHVRLPPQQCLEVPASRRISAPRHLIFNLEHRVLITTMTPPNPATDYQTSTHQQANSQRSPPRWFVRSARLLRRGRCCHHRLQQSPSISPRFDTIISKATIPLKQRHSNMPWLETGLHFNLPVVFAADRLIIQDLRSRIPTKRKANMIPSTRNPRPVSDERR